MEEERRELVKKVISILIVILIIGGIFMFLHSPPGPLKSRDIEEYKSLQWERYATPFISFYYPKGYYIDYSEHQDIICIKMPGNLEVMNIVFKPTSVTGKNQFSSSTSIPKSKFRSGYINDFKVWFYEEPIVDGKLVAILEKNRRSIIVTGEYHDTFGTTDSPDYVTQRSNLLRIIESLRFSNF